jgi:hypothetical protein
MLGRQIKDGPEKDRLVSVLLDNSELSESGCKTWRTFAYRPTLTRSAPQEFRRATKSGSVRATSFFKTDSKDRVMSATVAPLASESDALAYLPYSIGRITKHFPKIADVRDGYVEGQEVRGLPNALFYEVRLHKGPKEVRVARIVAGTVDSVVVIIDFESSAGLWPWEDVVAISEIQVAKIRRVHSEA